MIVYTRVIANWFDRRRGLALGFTLSGVGFGAFILPMPAQVLIDTVGWRGAYLGIAALVLVVTLPVTWWLLRDAPHALRTRTFWLIAVIGPMLHLAAMLSDRGMSPQAAAAVQASGPLAFGAALMLGLAADAEVDAIAYLMSRYFGLKRFGEVYGWQYATYTAAAGAAPIVTAEEFEVFWNYDGVLWGLAGMLLVAAWMLTRLGGYPAAETSAGR